MRDTNMSMTISSVRITLTENENPRFRRSQNLHMLNLKILIIAQSPVLESASTLECCPMSSWEHNIPWRERLRLFKEGQNLINLESKNKGLVTKVIKISITPILTSYFPLISGNRSSLFQNREGAYDKYWKSGTTGMPKGIVRGQGGTCVGLFPFLIILDSTRCQHFQLPQIIQGLIVKHLIGWAYG